MDIRVEFDVSKLDRIISISPAKGEEAIAALAFEGERIVKLSFGTGKAGRTYVRGGVTHTASAPGSPPAIDTGKLMNAIYVKPMGRLRKAISTGDTEYAAALEYGTTKMAARPFMRPMARELEREADDVFDRILGAAIEF